MSTRTIVGVAGLLLSTAAVANIPGTITGGGGLIPSAGTGDGTWQSILPSAPTSTSGTASAAVKSVKKLTLHGLSHTWMGDLQVVLSNGTTSVNVFVRPGHTGTGFGNSGDFLGGDYMFVDPGLAPTLPAAGNAAPGTYSQSFGFWTNGNHGIFNSPMSGLTSAGGATWTVRIYDWAGGDSGSFTGWTLDVNYVPAPGAAAMLGLAGLAGIRRRR